MTALTPSEAVDLAWADLQACHEWVSKHPHLQNDRDFMLELFGAHQVYQSAYQQWVEV